MYTLPDLLLHVTGIVVNTILDQVGISGLWLLLDHLVQLCNGGAFCPLGTEACNEPKADQINFHSFDNGLRFHQLACFLVHYPGEITFTKVRKQLIDKMILLTPLYMIKQCKY